MQQPNINQLPVLAVPKGRLGEIFNPLIDQAGFLVERQKRQDFGLLFDKKGDRPNTPLAITVYESYDDMSSSFQNGEIDAGIMGRDTLIEIQNRAGFAKKPSPLKITERFKNVTEMRCKLVIAGSSKNITPQSLNGAIIATKYPETARRWFDERGLKPREIRYRSGALEDIIRRGTADAICDIKQSGSTLLAYGLYQYFKIADVYPIWAEATNKQIRSNRPLEALRTIQKRIWETVNASSGPDLTNT